MNWFNPGGCATASWFVQRKRYAALHADALPKKLDLVLDAMLYRGELPRADVASLLSTSKRSARRVTSALLERGVLLTRQKSTRYTLLFKLQFAHEKERRSGVVVAACRARRDSKTCGKSGAGWRFGPPRRRISPSSSSVMSRTCVRMRTVVRHGTSRARLES